MTGELGRLRAVSRWFALMRLAAVPVAIVEVWTTHDFPGGYRTWAWVTCAVLAMGALVLAAFTWQDLSLTGRQRLAELALAFDTAIVYAFVFLYAWRSGQPTWSLFFLPVVEGALRFGIVGGIGMPLATTPLLVAAELFRSRHFEPRSFQFGPVTIRVALGIIVGAVVGRLVQMLSTETTRAESRAEEAERLRDELGRRADVLDAATRCARALSSSLVLDEAFQAFIRELRGVLAFDRMALVLAEDGAARVMATAGRRAQDILPPGTRQTGSVLDRVVTGETVSRADMSDRQFPEEDVMLSVGLRSRVAAPLFTGARPIGMLSVVRAEPNAFSEQEIELVTFLGRLVGSAVQNIRAYEAERRTVEELRRLSALRADFVSLVSHELRTPMASVIGSARTLQERWRELSPEQRDSFLALIAGETNRLAALVSDVLDTSRIEAGTFSYTFSDVDVAELVLESVAMAQLGQDEVRVEADIRDTLPLVRGDRDRLRQVLANLIDNAVKYSPAGGEVRVRAYEQNAHLCVAVSDGGPGIASEHRRLIFEKFGRANNPGAGTPGTGLGLFIARSIAEAHGGSLDVESALEQGTTFVLVLPAGSG
ncbi:MAG: ATP-binding protein [Actinomycetota bacterium]|nr:ATP-binding protein [Actinomycetota bacterium]